MDARWAQPCLVHTARKVFEVLEALEFNPVREVNLKTLSHWTILRGVHFMLWCLILGGSHGWLFEQEKFLSHPPFSPYSLSPHCPKRSTCRSLTYIHRIYHYILKCCSIFFPQPQFYFQHTYPRVLILWFPVQVWIWSELFLKRISFQVRSSYSGQGECLMSIEEIKIYLVLFNNFAFWALLRKNTWLFAWWKNALSSCDLSDCLIDS